LIRVSFKNVGQGDSIILEWSTNNKKSIGIIDSNIHEGNNPILEYLKENPTPVIDFIILSHFHYDHFSGMPDLFKYCLDKDIKINKFIHTFASHVLDIYNRIFTTKKEETASKSFFKYFDLLAENNIEDLILADCYTAPIQLTESEYLSFLAPTGKTYHQIAKNISRKNTGIIISHPDVNKLSTITCIQNEKKFILLTSDAERKSFKFINKKVSKQLTAIQVPHHGSYNSINPNFWKSVKRINDCPAILSVGDEPKDKLPDRQTIEFIDKEGYNIYSTNLVYGLCDYFQLSTSTTSNAKTTCLNLFSVKRAGTSITAPTINKYFGEKVFDLL